LFAELACQIAAGDQMAPDEAEPRKVITGRQRETLPEKAAALSR